MTWRKARRSDSQGGACVEVARLSEAIAMRDSKDPDGPKLFLSRQAFRTLVQGLGSGR
ncbi:DUF397 domain-containing protein [Actinomadura adrarensis]|uniref:DUF397 domain-containing protein n=1 Tax=Actinomadura adrarensis TaxID=1819600 RepID=A0ABW3CR20_9ACTN